MELLLAALLIFCLRITDVALGTLRIVLLVREKRRWAGVLGFFESLVWVLAARAVLTELDEPVKILAYAGGFAVGTVLGSTVERWMAMGTALVRVVAAIEDPQAYPHLQEAGFPTTVLNGEGRDGPVRIVFLVVPRRRVPEVLDVVASVNPAAFVTVEEAKTPNLAARRSAALVRK